MYRVLPVILRAAHALIVAATSQISPSDQEILEQLSSMYASVEYCTVAMAWLDGSERRNVIVQSDGAFASIDRSKTRSRLPDRWEEFPTHIVYFDGMTMRSTDYDSTEYVETKLEDYARTPPGPLQWMMCPWPVIPTYVGWLVQANDLTITSSNGEHVAESKSSKLRLAWRDDGAILEVAALHSDQDFVRLVYSDFSDAAGIRFPIPRRQLMRVYSVSNRSTPFDHSTDSRISIDLSEPDQNHVRFDASYWKLNRYDISTGAVTAPDGAFIYNRKEREAMFDRQSIWHRLRPWALGAGGVVLLVGMFFGYRRWRATA
jgi:hypothetical protein